MKGNMSKLKSAQIERSLIPENQILDWIKNHDLIKVNSLEKKCGIPQAMINKALSGKVALPVKHLPALLKALRPYGFRIKIQSIEGMNLLAKALTK